MSQQAIEKAKQQMVAVNSALEARVPVLEGLVSDKARARRLVYAALGVVAQTEELMRCTPISIARAVVSAALLNLDVAFGLGEAYLVPYANVCTLMPGYRGWQRKAREAGYNIEAEAVFDHDNFEYTLAPLSLKHAPCLSGDRGELLGIYAYATPINDPQKILKATWVSAEESTRAREMSKSPAWRTWPERMRRKLAISRLCKDLAGSHEGMRSLIELDAAAEAGVRVYDQRLDSVDDIEPVPLMPPPELPEGRQKASEASQPKEPEKKRGRPKGSKSKAKYADGAKVEEHKPTEPAPEPAHDPQTGEVAEPVQQAQEFDFGPPAMEPAGTDKEW